MDRPTRSIALGQCRFEVGAHIVHDLFHAPQMDIGEHGVSVFRNKNQMGVHEEGSVFSRADIGILSHKPIVHTVDVLLRYQYRVYSKPSQRIARAKAFGCARVVFNDAVAARKQAYRDGSAVSNNR